MTASHNTQDTRTELDPPRYSVLSQGYRPLTGAVRSCQATAPRRTGATEVRLCSNPSPSRDPGRIHMSDEFLSADPTEVGNRLLSRRALLTTGVAGAAAAYGLTATRGSAAVRPWSAVRTAAGTVTVGSNYSDPVPRKAIADVI